MSQGPLRRAAYIKRVESHGGSLLLAPWRDTRVTDFIMSRIVGVFACVFSAVAYFRRTTVAQTCGKTWACKVSRKRSVASYWGMPRKDRRITCGPSWCKLVGRHCQIVLLYHWFNQMHLADKSL